ncbi:M1 family metallopeptidase [Wenyingzhuangia sp. IMCC45574]
MKLSISIITVFITISVNAQKFSKQDSLRGSITAERMWWDVQKYILDVQVYPATKSIKGINTIDYKVVHKHRKLQLELQPPLVMDSIIQDNKKLNYKVEGFSYFVQLEKKQNIGFTESLKVYYHGKPKAAKKAPWDGGFVWGKDHNDKPFIATANQSIGASIWWPCKDHPSDEAASASITITCPSSLKNVSNGRNTKTIVNADGTTSYTWEVNNPINSYGIAVNIGDYVHFGEIYKGLEGDLTLNYHVLKDHLTKAKTHFKDAVKTIQALEHWFGPYPFYNDGYKLVETPYLGMEHQSCVAYGNKYLKGYLGHPMGSSKWGNKFDFIIVHESGHEWFANSITCNDVADLWVHEAFTTYSESLFLDYHYGTLAANEYVQGLRRLVLNDKPIIGVYNVHNEGSGDMYFKGSLMLHTLRQIINDDTLWRKMLQGLNKQFYHKIVTGKEIIDYLNTCTKLDLVPFFKQYLTTTNTPKLVLKQKGRNVYYKWTNVIPSFNIPVKITHQQKEVWITPKLGVWQKIKGNLQELTVDPNFYIDVEIDNE